MPRRHDAACYLTCRHWRRPDARRSPAVSVRRSLSRCTLRGTSAAGPGKAPVWLEPGDVVRQEFLDNFVNLHCCTIGSAAAEFLSDGRRDVGGVAPGFRVASPVVKRFSRLQPTDRTSYSIPAPVALQPITNIWHVVETHVEASLLSSMLESHAEVNLTSPCWGSSVNAATRHKPPNYVEPVRGRIWGQKIGNR